MPITNLKILSVFPIFFFIVCEIKQAENLISMFHPPKRDLFKTLHLFNKLIPLKYIKILVPEKRNIIFQVKIKLTKSI